MELTNDEQQYLQQGSEEMDEGQRIQAYADEEIALFGVPLGAYAINDVAHVSIRSVVLAKVYELMDQVEEGHDNATDSDRMIEELSEELEAKETEIASLKQAKYEAGLLAEENGRKRDNAYNELLDAKNEIDDLKAKLAAATAPKIPVRTNIEGSAGLEVKKPEKRAIYNVEYFGYNDNQYKAKFADTDEEFTDWSIYKDVKYQEVAEEQAHTFRTEPVVADDQRSSEVEEQPVEPEVPQFREEDEKYAIGFEVATPAPSMVGQFITEERISSIEGRIAQTESEIARIKGMLNI
mgnify:CR=1 FL=1